MAQNGLTKEEREVAGEVLIENGRSWRLEQFSSTLPIKMSSRRHSRLAPAVADKTNYKKR